MVVAMRILTVCQFFESAHGGGIVVARLLRRLLEERGHRVDVLCLEGGDDPQPGTIYRLKAPPFLSRNLTRQFLLFLNNRYLDRWFTRQVDTLGFKAGSHDVIHCQDFLGVGIAQHLAALIGAQWGVTLHEFLPRRMSQTVSAAWLGRLLETTCQWRDRELLSAYRSCTWLAGVSKAVSRSASQFLETWHCRVETVYNAYTPQFLVPTSPITRLDQSTRFLYVGRLSPEKGVDLLLDAFRQLPGADTLTLIGLPGSLQRAAERAAAADTRIRLSPPIRYEEMAAQYQAHDVVCCPARWEEPFGLTTLEARACGRVVVGMRRGGIPEILEGYGRSILLEGTPGSRENTVIQLRDALLQARALKSVELDEPFERLFLRQFSGESFLSSYERLYAMRRY